MEKRILLAYASKAGSTAEIAARLGERLAKRGAQVDVQPVGMIKDLSGYHTVILGSAIRYGRPLSDAMSFVEKNQAALQKKAFHAFLVCMTLENDSEENRKTVSAYLEPLRALHRPEKEGFFAGVVDPKKVGLLEKALIAAMKAPVGDFRKWDQIEAWADQVAV